MKRLIVLAAVLTFSSGSILERSARSVDQPPVLLGLEAVDPPGFVVTWQTMQELAGEPVDGYKVHVWELPDVETEHYVLVDGTPVKETMNVPAKIDDSVPKHTATVIDVPHADSGKIIYTPAKLHVQYEIRVQAYNGRGTGLLSNAVGLKLGN